MNILIQNGTILTMHNGKVIRQGAVAIEEETIVDVGKTSKLKRKYGRGYEKIDAKNKIVMPGFVNTHQHAAMSLLRGYADDLPLQEWLEKWIWPIEKHMTAHDIYVGALLTAVESIMGGTTTVNTMYHYTPEENEAKAFADAGLRGVIGHVCFSWRKEEDRKALWDLAKNWHNQEKGLIRVSVDPHAPYTVDPEYMKELKTLREDLSEKFGSENALIIWHTHVAETSDEKEKIRKTFNIQIKKGVIAYLDSLGVLNEKVIAAHCVAVTDEDIKIMKKRGVKVSHNPISNLKLASGISPIPKMLKEGVTVSLGTDSPCSNNTTDMFENMKTTAILHKGINKNPTLLPAEKTLEMATIHGAKALSWDKEIGSIAVGKKADLIIINLKKPHLSPLHNETSHMVYAAKASDVETVIINGKIIMENRTFKTLNIERVMALAEKAKNNLLRRVSAKIK
ncbi:MAG: amidohydrolase [Candidatus Bathycorpusculaceae bacterium]